jgi:hypothetical protein
MKIGFISMFVITMATRVYYVISSLASVSGKLSSWSHVIGTSMFLFVPLVNPVAEKNHRIGKKILGCEYTKKSLSFYYR